MRRQRNLLGPQGMGGMVSLWGASSLVVSSVQSGVIAIPAASNVVTATITAVNTTRSICIFGGCVSNNGAASPQASQCTAVLTNSTTVTGQRDAVGVADGGVRWMVIEFAPGVLRQVQAGTISLTGFNATATITTVNTAKTIVLFNGTRVAAALDNLLTQVRLLDATTVRGDRYSGTAAQSYVAYTAVEFF